MLTKNAVLSAVACAAVSNASPILLHQNENAFSNGEKAHVMTAPNLGKFVPTYPKQYTVTGIMHIPYADVHEPVKVQTDEEARAQKVTYYDGRDAMLYLNIGEDTGMTYETYIGYNRPMCFQSKLKKGTDTQDRMDREVKFIPDLKEFEYRGKTPCNPAKTDELCHHWSQEKSQGFHNQYVYYAKDDELYTPYYLSMVGRNVVFASHYDMYNVEYLTFEPTVDSSAFEVPECSVFLGGRDDHHHAVREEIDSLMNAHDHVSDKFDEHVVKFNKTYADDKELLEGHLNFRVSHHTVNNMNKQGDDATYGHNHASDLSTRERNGRMFGYRKSYKVGKPSDHVHVNRTVSKMIVDTNIKVPDAVDWRLDGAVTPVKDQGTCGSCWAFSTTGAMEGAYFLKTGRLNTLSEQQLMDCSWAYTNNGCDGGEPAMAMDYLTEVGGIMDDSSYKYENADNYCRYNPEKKAASIKGRVLIPSGDEFALKQAVALHGPVSVAFDASKPSLLYYSSGVYRDPNCSTTDLDHAVLVVGYGTTELGDDYWIVKNSWSTYWGDMGYFKIARNDNNHCGIATDATYVVV
ncbi:hypothetical protein SARC_05646 [Sphaeroforma arctica JP610]|uniref:Peptidase C1A papain C-terminal domain-containing protein n=1 Tax=Sphaeroforma arctica JP610 TaxID=667725 RepID=A0A0L0FYY4_9EUKA|nr:hypothetical protein SARC_05646 [Sphaeroforma arctica JP610]KNC82052.1 hypothetical protein SARC_05646 [Sphaeroforma arctica JP610]|eukprot:XP_014155954.1 hypothetical protein SARC_05646 [Sphaeroforma arctica JP610]